MTAASSPARALSINSSGYEARVFSVQGVIIQVDQAGNRIEDDIFQNGAEAPRAGINLRLGGG